MIHAPLMFVPFSRLANALCQITPPRKVIGVKSASKINSATNSNSYVAYYVLQLSRLRKEPKTWLTGGISSLRKHINRYFPLRSTSCMHLTGYIQQLGHSREHIQDKMRGTRHCNVPRSRAVTETHNRRSPKRQNNVVYAVQTAQVDQRRSS